MIAGCCAWLRHDRSFCESFRQVLKRITLDADGMSMRFMAASSGGCPFTFVALPECSGPGVCETILDGARLSSNREAAAAAEHFPALSAEALREITRGR